MTPLADLVAYLDQRTAHCGNPRLPRRSQRSAAGQSRRGPSRRRRSGCLAAGHRGRGGWRARLAHRPSRHVLAGSPAADRAFYRKIKIAMDAGLAIYSSAPPARYPPGWGNNSRLAKAIGLIDPQPFFEWKGIHLGLRGTWQGNPRGLAARLEKRSAAACMSAPAAGEHFLNRPDHRGCGQ
jgi:hypothetical protein